MDRSELEERLLEKLEEGVFNELRHPRTRGGEFRTLRAIKQNPGHNMEYPDKGESVRIKRLMDAGHVRVRARMTTPDTVGELELTPEGERRLKELGRHFARSAGA